MLETKRLRPQNAYVPQEVSLRLQEMEDIIMPASRLIHLKADIVRLLPNVVDQEVVQIIQAFR